MTTAAAAHRGPVLRARVAELVLPVFTGLLLILLFAPIAVMIAFSFNDPGGRQNITWQGFTLRNYVDLWGRSEITDPMIVSVAVAAISTVVATSESGGSE